MHSHFDCYLNVRELILEKKPKIVLELGVFDGKNTRKLVELQNEVPFCLICVSDHWPDKDLFEVLPKDAAKCVWMRDLSYRAIPSIDAEIDFSLIDTDHNYWTLKQELSALYPKVPCGGMICMHDTQTYRKNSGKADMYGTKDNYPGKEIDDCFKAGKGMGDAIWEFLSEHQDYIVRRQVIEANGAMALERVNA